MDQNGDLWEFLRDRVETMRKISGLSKLEGAFPGCKVAVYRIPQQGEGVDAIRIDLRYKREEVSDV